MIRQDIKILFYLILLFPSIIISQTIDEISISNNKKFSSSQYLSWIKINTGSRYFVGISDSIRTRLSESLNDQGFYNSSIKKLIIKFSDDSTNVNINIHIVENDPTYISQIKFANTDSTDFEYLKKLFLYNNGSVFNKYELEETIDQALYYYENNGYPFTVIKFESIFFEYDSTKNQHQAEILLSLDKRQQSKIDQIKITGNEKTSDDVILRNMNLEIGDYYSQEKIDQIPTQLNKLRFFETVSTPNYYFNSKENGILEIKLKERSTNNFDGIIGYVPGDDKTDGYFTGFINVSLRNLFGTGRALAFRWQRETSLTQEIEIKYLEPWILGYPFNISGEFFQRKQDTTYVKRFLKGELEFIATDVMSAALLIESESIIPTLNNRDVFTVYNSSILTTGVQLLYDTRNDFYSPTSGLMLLNAYKYSEKKINGPKRFIPDGFDTKLSLQKFELDIHYLLPIVENQITSFFFHARELRSDFFEISDLYQFGGTNTLRGYREKQFSGNRLIWGNFEYRYLLSKKSYAYAFYDIGYYLRDQIENIQKLSSTKTGYGFGLNIETAMGVMNVSYALGEGDSFSTGKIHFGLINEF